MPLQRYQMLSWIPPEGDHSICVNCKRPIVYGDYYYKTQEGIKHEKCTSRHEIGHIEPPDDE